MKNTEDEAYQSYEDASPDPIEHFYIAKKKSAKFKEKPQEKLASVTDKPPKSPSLLLDLLLKKSGN